MGVHTELQGISVVDSCAHNAEVACSTQAPATSLASAEAALLGALGMRLLMTDELTGESVRVDVLREGSWAGVTGRGDLLNFFCAQLPHFRGLLNGDESLPKGRDIYVRVRDADNKPELSPRLYRLSNPTPQ